MNNIYYKSRSGIFHKHTLPCVTQGQRPGFMHNALASQLTLGIRYDPSPCNIHCQYQVLMCHGSPYNCQCLFPRLISPSL